MAEQHHQEFSSPREDPPDSVPNPRVRRAALWLYVAPLAAFILAGGIFVWYFSTRPPASRTDDENVWKATGTTGETSPGGHSPDPVPPSPDREIEERGALRDLSEPSAPRLDTGLMLTGLTQIKQLKPEQMIGRRIDVQDVSVVDVKNETTFEVQDGATRVAVVNAGGSPAVHPGQRVSIVGTMERNDAGGVRIRASRVDVRN